MNIIRQLRQKKETFMVRRSYVRDMNAFYRRHENAVDAICIGKGEMNAKEALSARSEAKELTEKWARLNISTNDGAVEKKAAAIGTVSLAYGVFEIITFFANNRAGHVMELPENIRAAVAPILLVSGVALLAKAIRSRNFTKAANIQAMAESVAGGTYQDERWMHAN